MIKKCNNPECRNGQVRWNEMGETMDCPICHNQVPQPQPIETQGKSLGKQLYEAMAMCVFGKLGGGITLWTNRSSPKDRDEQMYCLTNQDFDEIAQVVADEAVKREYNKVCHICQQPIMGVGEMYCSGVHYGDAKFREQLAAKDAEISRLREELESCNQYLQNLCKAISPEMDTTKLPAWILHHSITCKEQLTLLRQAGEEMAAGLKGVLADGLLHETVMIRRDNAKSALSRWSQLTEKKS